jgi:hypothetical protein
VSHTHSVDESQWPFDTPLDTAVFTTRQVMEGHPILEVHHDPDGDWQFVCGTTGAREDGRLVCLGCVIGQEPALAQLADLPIGWFAYRSAPDKPWARTKYAQSWE